MRIILRPSHGAPQASISTHGTSGHRPPTDLTVYEVYRLSAPRTSGIGVADFGDGRVSHTVGAVRANFDDQWIGCSIMWRLKPSAISQGLGSLSRRHGWKRVGSERSDI